MRFWLLIFSGLVFIPSALKAQAVALGDFRDATDYDDDFDDDVPANEGFEPPRPNDEGELSYDDRELRGFFRYGAMLGAGAFAPYSLVGADFIKLSSVNLAYVFGIGGGHTKIDGSHDGKSYSFEAKAQSFHANLRYFFSGVLPLYGEVGGGLGVWTGSVEPRGTDIERANSANLTSSFSAQTVFASAGLGLQTYWENGWSLDYSIAGFAKNVYVHSTLARNDDESKTVVGEDLKRPSWFGLVNLRVGYFLKN